MDSKAKLIRSRATDEYHLYVDGEIEEPLDPEMKAEIAEQTVFSAILLRTDLDMVWLAASAAQCVRNVRRHRVALLRHLRDET